ncbi:glycosyltransferase family 4 protein [Paenibacillus sp. S28]|uniref:glycosyltransferase family 4 protein n=1 Tax=Paenibacillus sp. S28 TaxID=2767463 RepID=UPI00190AC2BD|nr:glycosyltransferase family 4 protein [Paenibacillus sp. S28]MBJ9991089.1 glycosyltransferase family 4 protein [Paenibacillus sp. S28]
MKIVIVGPLPPPIGGISVHIRRLSRLLQRQGMECIVYNESGHRGDSLNVVPMLSYRRFLLQIPFIQGDLIHFHTIDKRLRLLLGVYRLLGKKIMLTVHGESLAQQLKESSPLMRRMLLRSLKSLNGIVCVNPATTQMLLDQGFHSDRVKTIPAYIHPEDREEDARAIPAEVHAFLDGRGFVISANGFIRQLPEGDAYGVNLLIEVMRELKSRGLAVRCLFAVLGSAGQSAEERLYYEQLRNRVRGYGLDDSFSWYEAEQTELYPILKKSHLFIRPTLTDGYGVSIAEALRFQIPAVASNVCRRPEGTVLFSSGNVGELTDKVLDIMNRYRSYKEETAKLKPVDYGPDLIEWYRRIVKDIPEESQVIPHVNG